MASIGKKILRMKKILLCFISFLLLSTLNISCGTDEFAAARSKKIRVDTLTNNMIIELRPELDSLCEYRTEALIQLAIDSIMPIRLEEIEEMLRN